MQKLIDALEDLDDVQQVYTSADFDDENNRTASDAEARSVT